MAERSYHTSKVRGSGREELPHARDQGWRPGALGCDGTGVAERSYPTSEVRGGDRERQAATSAGATERGYPAAERGYPTPEVRGSGHEEQPRPRSCAVWAEEG